MRKRYKTKKDAINAKTILVHLRDQVPYQPFDSNWLFEPLDKKSHISHRAYDPSNVDPETSKPYVTALLQVRNRNMSFYRFDSIMLTEFKFKTGIRMSKRMCLPYFFVVGLMDRVIVYQYQDGDENIFWSGIGGRTKQLRDPEDIENVVKIPIGRFDTASDYNPVYGKVYL